jgi:hypothetical protein
MPRETSASVGAATSITERRNVPRFSVARGSTAEQRCRHTLGLSGQGPFKQIRAEHVANRRVHSG